LSACFRGSSLPIFPGIILLQSSFPRFFLGKIELVHASDGNAGRALFFFFLEAYFRSRSSLLFRFSPLARVAVPLWLLPPPRFPVPTFRYLPSFSRLLETFLQLVLSLSFLLLSEMSLNRIVPPLRSRKKASGYSIFLGSLTRSYY